MNAEELFAALRTLAELNQGNVIDVHYSATREEGERLFAALEVVEKTVAEFLENVPA